MKFDDLYNRLSGSSTLPVIAVPSPEDIDILKALKEARAMNLADAILVGKKSRIVNFLTEIGLSDTEFEIISEDNPLQSAFTSVQLVRDGKAHLLMKGKIATADLMKAVLNKENGLRTGRVLSHIAITEVASYDKLMFFTDGGINIDQTLNIKCDIVNNALESCRKLGIKTPHVALLTLVENVTPRLPETEIAGELYRLWQKGEFPDSLIEGPIALDVALSEKAAKKKGITSKIAGKTDVFVGANITATNHIVKSLVQLAGARVGGVIVGALSPIILLSRSDSSRIKLDSIAAAIALSR